MVFSVYFIATAKFKIKITHRCLESGHSYSEVDAMHARIEKEAKGKHIFSQAEWYALIQSTKQEDEQYRLYPIRTEEVMNFHSLVDSKGGYLQWGRRASLVVVVLLLASAPRAGEPTSE